MPDPGASIEVRVCRLAGAGAPDPIAPPRYATAGSVGLDLSCASRAPLVLQPGERGLVPTGFAWEIPRGWEGQVRPRSGWALRAGVTVLNSPGTIDPDFRGELQVLLINHGAEPVTIQRHDRVAQLVLAPAPQARVGLVDALSESDRSGGGFGHTGLGRAPEP